MPVRFGCSSCMWRPWWPDAGEDALLLPSFYHLFSPPSSPRLLSASHSTAGCMIQHLAFRFILSCRPETPAILIEAERKASLLGNPVSFQMSVHSCPLSCPRSPDAVLADAVTHRSIHWRRCALDLLLPSAVRSHRRDRTSSAGRSVFGLASLRFIGLPRMQRDYRLPLSATLLDFRPPHGPSTYRSRLHFDFRLMLGANAPAAPYNRCIVDSTDIPGFALPSPLGL